MTNPLPDATQDATQKPAPAPASATASTASTSAINPTAPAEQKNGTNFFQHLNQSFVIWAVLAFILIDGILKTGSNADARFWPITPDQSAHHSWVWWNVHDFQKEKQAPDIVLLGSSLMMAAFHGGDAAALNVPQNVALPPQKCAA